MSNNRFNLTKEKLGNILGAGTLTGLVLATFLIFGGRNANASDVITTASASPPEVTSLQVENEQLRQAVEILQAREAQYQQQLENASQAINNLQAAPANTGRYQEYESEHEEYEEHGEFNGIMTFFSGGEHDD